MKRSKKKQVQAFRDSGPGAESPLSDPATTGIQAITDSDIDQPTSALNIRTGFYVPGYQIPVSFPFRKYAAVPPDCSLPLARRVAEILYTSEVTSLGTQVLFASLARFSTQVLLALICTQTNSFMTIATKPPPAVVLHICIQQAMISVPNL